MTYRQVVDWASVGIRRNSWRFGECWIYKDGQMICRSPYLGTYLFQWHTVTDDEIKFQSQFTDWETVEYK